MGDNYYIRGQMPYTARFKQIRRVPCKTSTCKQSQHPGRRLARVQWPPGNHNNDKCDHNTENDENVKWYTHRKAEKPKNNVAGLHQWSGTMPKLQTNNERWSITNGLENMYKRFTTEVLNQWSKNRYRAPNQFKQFWCGTLDILAKTGSKQYK